MASICPRSSSTIPLSAITSSEKSTRTAAGDCSGVAACSTTGASSTATGSPGSGLSSSTARCTPYAANLMGSLAAESGSSLSSISIRHITPGGQPESTLRLDSESLSKEIAPLLGLILGGEHQAAVASHARTLHYIGSTSCTRLPGNNHCNWSREPSLACALL